MSKGKRGPNEVLCSWLFLPCISKMKGIHMESGFQESAKPRSVFLAYLGCLAFPCIVMAMVMTYEQNGDEPGPFPYNAVEFVFYADLVFTVAIIALLKGYRILLTLFSIPMLALTAVMVFFAGMWFTGNYL
jgi:hypothetical protein